MKIYDTRYQARKDARSDEKTVKVCGGYTNMTYDAYRAWKNQK